MRLPNLLLFLLLSGYVACAQTKIIKVEFNGLTHTKPEFLQAYLTQKVGDVYDSLLTQADRQRMLNLNILSQIEVVIAKTEGGVALTYKCAEMMNTLPIFALGQTENTFWCRAGIQSLNLTGRADKFFAYYQYYDRHSFYLNYSTDRLNNSDWGITGSLIKWATLEPLTTESGTLNFTYTNYTGYASLQRFLSFRETLDWGVGMFSERFELPEAMPLETEKIIQGRKFLSKLIFRSNHLNYNTFLVDGFYNQLNVEFIHAVEQVQNFITVFNDFRHFSRLSKRFNLANRLRVGIATNDDNPFAPFVLDSYLNIRGVGNRVDRGTGSVVINSELRYTLFDHNKWAAQGVAFIDFGSWRKPGGSLQDFKKSENMKAFTGLGTRLIYKQAFDTMLRVDVGYDYDKKTGVIIGIGQYF
jgi:outer membrane protein insertion porin family